MLNHVALQVDDRNKAEEFYSGVLGIPKTREFVVPANLTEAIFGRSEDVSVLVFSNEAITFEIFVTGQKPPFSYAHTCLNAENCGRIIENCKARGIQPNIIKKQDRELLFVRDFAGNLFEIKDTAT